MRHREDLDARGARPINDGVVESLYKNTAQTDRHWSTNRGETLRKFNRMFHCGYEVIAKSRDLLIQVGRRNKDLLFCGGVELSSRRTATHDASNAGPASALSPNERPRPQVAW